MLERFKVPEEIQVRIPERSFRATINALYLKTGMPPEDAALATDVIVTTDLWGNESHGVSNELRGYIQSLRTGHINPRPNVRIVREFPGSAVIDGDKGHGSVVGPRAMEMAIEKARTTGVAAVTVFNCGHAGGVGYHAMLAAKQDMVGMSATNWGGGVLPTFGAEPRLGTNPISFAAPARNEAPLMFDAATSQVPSNKINIARRLGAKMMPGWIADENGVPIMKEVPVPSGKYYKLLLGSTREMGSHKGYGLNMMVETLAGFLNFPFTDSPSGGHFFAAFNIAAFTDVDKFKTDMDRRLKTLRETRPAPGHDRVFYPGLPEFETELERRANGIPLHLEVVEWFDRICEELGVEKLQRP